MSWTGSIRLFAAVSAFHLAAVVLCLMLFLTASAAGLFGDVAILFYRGLAELAAIAPVLLGGLILLARRRWAARFLSGRGAVAATLVAVSPNLSFFGLGAVSVECAGSAVLVPRR